MNRRSWFASLAGLVSLPFLPKKALSPKAQSMETPWGLIHWWKDTSYLIGEHGIYRSVGGSSWLKISREMVERDAYGDPFHLGRK